MLNVITIAVFIILQIILIVKVISRQYRIEKQIIELQEQINQVFIFIGRQK